MEGTACAKAQKRDDKGSCWGAVESWSERLLRFSNGVFEGPPLGILICNNAEQGILEQGRHPQPLAFGVCVLGGWRRDKR